MKLPIDPRLPQNPTILTLTQRLTELFRLVANQVNGLSEGSVAASYQALVSAPTTGAYQWGDFVRNKEPIEQGTAGSKYIVLGWTCTSSGTPGTWVAARALTGN